MKRKILLILMILTFSVVGTMDVAKAETEDMMENLLPDEKAKKVGDVELESTKYPLTRYGMDTDLEDAEFSDIMPWGWDDNIGKQINQGLSTINSALWGLNKIMAGTIMTVVHEAFELDIISKFSEAAGKMIKSISGVGSGGIGSNGLWPYFGTFIICALGIWAAFKGVVQRQQSVAIGGIISSVFIVAIALGFFANADKVLNGINDATTSVQNEILSFSLSSTTPGEYSESEGLATMKNQIFNVMVKYPWLLLEFGTTDEKAIEKAWDKKGSRTHAILNTGVISEERKEAIEYEVEELGNNNMSIESITDRLVVLILVLVSNFILGFIMVLLSGSLILYQILALVFSAFLPLSLLMALIPSWQGMAWNSIAKVLHAFYMKIALALLATIYFTLSSMVYNNINPSQGLIIMFILQIITAVAIWIKKDELLNVINRPFNAFGAGGAKGLDIQEYKQSYFKTKKHLNTITKPLTHKPTQSLADRTGYNKLKVNPGVGMVNPMKQPITRTRNNPVTNPDQYKKTAATRTINRKDIPAKQAAAQQTTVTRPQPRNVQHGHPTLDDKRNLASLSKTLDKGGHAHRVKDSVEMKDKPAKPVKLVDRNIENRSE